MILGICLPVGAASKDATKLFLLEDGATVNFAEDLAQLRTSTDANVFLDTTKDILYRKFTEDRARGPNDLTDCIGGLRSLDFCPMIRVRLSRWADELNLSQGDCTN